jgi:hypothetical protein
MKGLGFGYYWPQISALAIYTLAVYGVAWLLLRKRIG